MSTFVFLTSLCN